MLPTQQIGFVRFTDSEYQCVAGHKACCSKSETQTQGRDGGASAQLNSGLGQFSCYLHENIPYRAKRMWTPEFNH